MRKITGKFDLKFKIFYSVKDTAKWVRRQATDYEKILGKKADKGLLNFF